MVGRCFDILGREVSVSNKSGTYFVFEGDKTRKIVIIK